MDATPDSAMVRHRFADVDGLRIFYREAGPRSAPTLLLLHGFPSSSHMFRHLLPALADRWHVVAPDYPGFGASDFPSRDSFAYGFESFAAVVERLTHVLGLERYALYLQDYGAPVGLRLALRAPQRVSALVVQNGNAYDEGLSGEWEPLRAYWREPTAQRREALRGWLGVEGTRLQYTAGLDPAQIERIAPETWWLDAALLARPGNTDMQLDLFADYAGNLELYPRFQAFLREQQPPTLIAWGRRDPFFTVDGARAYLRDLPRAELHLLDEASHFALESHGPTIAGLMRDFLGRHLA
jgi:pimeloyl-ACP methyl ester carboxylesterase